MKTNHPNSVEKNSPVVTYIFQTPHIGSLEGKMLTLVEASISDPEQRKSLKDIVRQTIWNWAIEHNIIDLYDWEVSNLAFPSGNAEPSK